MSHRRFAYPLAILVAAVGALAGCGGGGGEEETPFQADANEICSSAGADFAEATAKLGATPSKREQDDLVRRELVPGINDAMEQIADLPPPSDVAADVDRMVAAARQGGKQIEQDPALFLSPPAPDQTPYAEAADIAHEIGLGKCFVGS